jgi:hypothetical protein
MTREEKVALMLAEVSMLASVKAATMDFAKSILEKLTQLSVDEGAVVRGLRAELVGLPPSDATAADARLRRLLEDVVSEYDTSAQTSGEVPSGGR